ncbi:serine/threonine protein kinase [Leifsonia sp. 98AMF]|nr:serine/threonine protein kinase [Leifsonia sp. 197AMF]SDI93784.1 serine/threonine protein kinase [Leifsonia sp. 466MF]SDJ84305.1 serine/threonine protein kinase [Leifsonia sp. 157MF]SDN97542.1 serine/threonine protein kinase [Leifsonia sp. 509MF]SEN07737.1 serine/threonine protein kinase [Leifsonia sp. 467MF]SFM09001.1 serine/threonine protein kinase [Leifsonia sp. 98AMF]
MIGRLIDGRYQVRSRIARGGMATVYLATDLRLERRVAIKIMHGHLADDSTFKSRFVQEARSAARLAHPNVVNVFDQGQDSDMAYLVMEYLPGITLRDLLKDYGKLTPEQTIDIMEAVLAGLAAAHKAGIVHRDLKPENVLLADDGRIKIGDFGLARAASANTATGQALLGTIAYLSPELVTRGVADARSDIYALGIMMYEMLTGQQPFQGEQPMQIAYQHANDAVPAPSSKNPAVPAELDELVLWATEKDPDRRPRDAREMLDRLLEAEKALRGEAVLQPTMVLPPAYEIDQGDTQIINPAIRQQVASSTPAAATTLTTAAAKRRSKGWWLFALVLVLAGVAAGTGWYFGAGPGSLVAIPNVVNKAPDAAVSQLQKLGFKTAQAPEYSTTVAAGMVSSTDPGAGVPAGRGSTVTLRVSQGPKPVTIPPLAGTTIDTAKSAITGVGAKVGTVAEQFDAKVPANTVISATRADNGADISGGGNYFEAASVNLVVSVGAIPDVAGKSVEDASAILSKVKLLTSAGPQSYSDTVEEGDVISAQPQHEPVRPGDTLLLETSKGPEPVTIPDVAGKTWDVAKKALTDAGFKLKYSAIADVAPNAFVVSKVSPAGGTQAPKGSTITVNFAGF